MRFATCLNCMDGRIQLPVIYWIKEHYPIDYVDMITEPGMDGLLAIGENEVMKTLLKKIDISIQKHQSSILFVVGHYDCGGNPVDEKTHKHNILAGVNRLKTYIPSMTIVGLWVSDEWLVDKIIEA